MRKFLIKTVLILVPISLLLCSGIFLPPTPRASKSLLFANRQKDSLLLHTKEPRIIFIGGSNLSFGLNSQRIKDSLNLNPINTAVNAGIGIKYMLENTLQYIKSGDVIILAFEYDLFQRSYEYTTDELLRIIVDVCPEKIKLISFFQIIDLFRHIPKFSLTKFVPSEYIGFKESDVYSVNSFNNFGDVNAHWNLDKRGYNPVRIKGNFNEKVIRKIKEFEKVSINKGAAVYITFPCLDEVSFNDSKEKIFKIESVLKKYDFNLLGNAKRYIMPKEMMFNSRYHLIKKGVEYRTNLFIADYNNAQKLIRLDN